MSIYKRFAKDVGIVAIAEVIVKFRAIIFLPILTAFLSVSDYGIYATLLVTVTFIMPFSSLGARFGIIRLLSAEEDKKKVSKGIFSVSLLTLIVSLVLSAVFFLLAGLLANTVFGEPTSVAVIQIGVLLIPLQSLFDNSLAFFLMRQKMFLCSVFSILESFLPIAAGSAVLILGGRLQEFIWSFVISEAFLTIVAYSAIAKSTGFSLPRLREAIPYVKFGMPMVAGKFSSTILNVGDRYVIGLILGAAAVGAYSVAYTIGSTVMMFLAPISTALLAPVSKSYDKERHEEVKKYMHYSIRYFLMFAIPATVGLTILAEPLTNSLTNSRFLEGTFGVTAIIAFSSIFYGLFSLDSTIFYLKKHVHMTSGFLMVASVANIALNFILIPRFALLGSALATLISFMGLFFGSYYFSRKRIKIPFDLVFISKCAVASFFMGAIVYFLEPVGWLRILAVALLGAFAYFGLLVLEGAVTKGEITLGVAFLRKKLLKSRGSGT